MFYMRDVLKVDCSDPIVSNGELAGCGRLHMANATTRLQQIGLPPKPLVQCRVKSRAEFSSMSKVSIYLKKVERINKFCNVCLLLGAEKKGFDAALSIFFLCEEIG